MWINWRWRNAHVLNLLLVAVLVGLSISWWNQLPERVPVHFDLSGTVDRWGSKGIMWWALPALSALATVMIYGAAALSRRYPQLVNLPRRIRLSDLAAEVRGRVITMTQGLMYWLAVPMNLTWLLLQAAARQAALGAPRIAARFVLGTVAVAAVLVPVVILAFYVSIVRIVKSSGSRSAGQSTSR